MLTFVPYILLRSLDLCLFSFLASLVQILPVIVLSWAIAHAALVTVLWQPDTLLPA